MTGYQKRLSEIKALKQEKREQAERIYLLTKDKQDLKKKNDKDCLLFFVLGIFTCFIIYSFIL